MGANRKQPGRSPTADLLIISIALVSAAGFALNGGLLAGIARTHPYLNGFVSFALLSTFGECIGLRLSGGSWLPDRIMARAIVWGLLGVWISAAFPFTAAGVYGISSAGLWPTKLGPLGISIWANILSGYGFFMILTHYWASSIIAGRARWPWEIFDAQGFSTWAKTVLISLVLFWIPAHTVTFMLPEYWRVLFSAGLGIVLGVILTIASEAKGGSKLHASGER